MEIVKKRKRRLLAWILIMTLGICMWQSNVFANEGIGDSNLEEPASVSDNTIENEDGGDSTNIAQVKVLLSTRDKDCYIESGSVFSTSNYQQKIPVSEDGKPIPEVNVAISDVPEDSLSDAFVSKKISLTDTEEYEVIHNVIEWEYAAMGSEDGIIETKTVNGNTLKNLQSIANESKGEITALLGKAMIINFWEGTDASGNLNNLIDVKTVSQESEEEGWKITLEKNEKNKNNSAGAFLVKWQDQDKIEYENSYEGIYDEFESEKDLIAVYSTTINGTGSYSLKMDTEYELQSGSWKVDEYTYDVGDGGFFFYVAEDGEYQFE